MNLLLLPVVALVLLAAMLGALACFPSLRETAMRGAARYASGLGEWQRRIGSGCVAALGEFGSNGRAIGVGMGRRLTRNRTWLALGVVAVGLPVGLAITVSASRPLEGFEDRARVADPVLAALLEGEHLVPPPALPPEIFVTEDIKRDRPDIATASRDWALVDGEFRQRLLVLFQQMHERGYEMALLEGYRSPERQSELAALGPNVTRAGAFQSYHQFGLAADLAFLRDGRLVISERDPWAMEGYRILGERAEALGLTWGGRWKLMDFGHVELRRGGVLGRK